MLRPRERVGLKRLLGGADATAVAPFSGWHSADAMRPQVLLGGTLMQRFLRSSGSRLRSLYRG